MPIQRHTLHSQLAAAITRPPITVLPETPLREALQLMVDQRVGSVVINEPESGKPLGIFTLRDLLYRVAVKDFDLDRMVMSVMSDSNLQMLHWRATLYQAGLLMARHGVHHVIVVDASGRTAGVVSQEDIHALQSGGGKAISGAIRNARDVEGLIAVASDIRGEAMRMLEEGMATEPLTQLISSLNDHLTVRLIELTTHDFPLPRVPWSWLAFGSEGRFEQTLSTDQDNGIVFANGSEPADTLRPAFLAFARAMNERLAACGFPLCKGNVMASNPELCLSVEEWQGKFRDWIHAPNPQALLNATIYFDLRTLYGEEQLVEDLRTGLLAQTRSANLFLRFMTENALAVLPPLGWLRQFRFDDAAHPRSIDLKTYGTRLFVDMARILALANGIAATGTAERLHALGRSGRLGGEDVEAMIDAFQFLQQLRLRQQQRGAVSAEGANRVEPEKLNELNRLILHAAFNQAKKLQARLRLEYRL